ncbi:MAG TPA: tryptophan 7-halogenase [Woeseiaceae bacterium]|nr:tryptophan 7-halogenase [Woeseiaceae bacterium]
MSGADGIRRVVVLGGGLAGWAAAAGIAHSLRGSGVSITVVDTPRSRREPRAVRTLPGSLAFFRHLGIGERDLLLQADAHYCLGTEFRDWPAEGQRRLRAFGAYGADIGFIPFHHYLVRSRAAGGTAVDINAYSVSAAAAAAGRFAHAPPDARTLVAQLAYGLCFDSRDAAALLRRYAERHGVQRVASEMTTALRHDATGCIASLHLADGRSVGGDLFIDCSNADAALLGATLQVGIEADAALLPCDRLYEFACDRHGAAAPRTDCTLTERAWLVATPLQRHTVTACLCPDGALDGAGAAALAARHGAAVNGTAALSYRFANGRRQRAWHLNCIALGDAAGALEPLAVHSFDRVQSGIARLLRMFPRTACDTQLAEEYNRLTRLEFEHMRDYLLVSYELPAARPAGFRTRPGAGREPSSYARRRALFAATGRHAADDDDTFDRHAWVAAWLAAGLWPAQHDPLLDRMDPAGLDSHFTRLREAIAAAVAALPAHGEYLARLRAAKAPGRPPGDR